MIEINNSWYLLTIATGITLVLSVIMSRLSEHFYTNDVVIKKFSIMELQLPATAKEFMEILKGLYLMLPARSKKALGSLKLHTALDFLFMPFAYGAVFLLCMKVAVNMQSGIGRTFFITLAWLQMLAWLCDIIENIYLLYKIGQARRLVEREVDAEQDIRVAENKVYKVSKEKDEYSKGVFWITVIKWVCALAGLVSSIGCIAYFWLSGLYNQESLMYILYIVIEIIVFILLIKFLIKDKSELYIK